MKTLQIHSFLSYPFGMLMGERTFSSEKYRWGFNGKEKDDEASGAGNNLDYGARIYDGRLGRWMSVDPLLRNYPNLTPYHYTNNNPILFIDKDGRDYEIYINHDSKTIIIKATYLEISGKEELKNQMATAVEFYNSYSDKFKYVVRTGNSLEVYNVQFKLEIGKVEHIMDGGYNIPNTKSVANFIGGIPQKNLDEVKLDLNEKVQGYNIGDIVKVSNNQIGTKRGLEILKHEIGHSLGMLHSLYGIMGEYGDGDGLSSSNLYSLLGKAGYGSAANIANEKHQIGKPVIKDIIGKEDNFNAGEFVSSKKANKMIRKNEKRQNREARRNKQ